ncbi:ribokinase [uncultured Williamsia sp.]|uniref:ribokinase n=1 Tax=uncultured Williamsia sp. TaxID=259311 RepID=UPI0026289F93|nr:ribokinase [uncultured Williamsia sp.]
MGAAVVVVGSVNTDVVAELDRFPRPGETLRAVAVRRNLGGKGANQAVAARRVHDDVAFIGRVGDGAQGDGVREELAGHGVDVDHTRTVPDAATGTAFIQVAAGENTIVLDAGANDAWDRLDDAERRDVADAAVVVCQMEIPSAVNRAVAQACRGRLVVNAAPAREVTDLLSSCDPLVVNEHELAVLTGVDVDGPTQARSAARSVLDRGARSVVVTLGAAGAVWVTTEGGGVVTPPDVEVVDSTGAGDAFVGVLAARLAVGGELGDAIRWAVAAGSLAVQTSGTHASYPDADGIVAMLDSIVSKS